MAQMSILQIGNHDWSAQVENMDLDWHFTTSSDLPFLLAHQADPSFLAYTYVVLTDATPDATIITRQIKEWPAFRVIYLADVVTFDFELKQALADRGAFYFAETTPESVANRILTDLYLGQAGFATRFSEEQFIPTTNYHWHLQRSGRFSATFSGDFGSEYQQIGTLKTFPGDYLAEQENLIYCDYDQTGSAELALCFVFYQGGRLQLMQMISGPTSHQLTAIKAPKHYQDYQIIVLAKGEGTLDLHNLHQRRSRHGLGHFLPGGRRDLTTDGQEVFSYFNPGTKKGPLIVLFADTHMYVEGFDGWESLLELGYPFLLFTDTRTKGGAFMVGNEPYEALVIEKIKASQNQLGLSSSALIFAGSAMGSYPAMYYSGKIGANHLILAKPIINLGTFTSQGTFAHQGVNQDWPLDSRYLLAGRFDLEDTQELNQKLWLALNEVNWAAGSISLLTLDEDLADGQSLPELLAYFDQQEVLVNRQKLSNYQPNLAEALIEFLKKEVNHQVKVIKAEGWR